MYARNYPTLSGEGQRAVCSIASTCTWKSLLLRLRNFEAEETALPQHRFANAWKGREMFKGSADFTIRRFLIRSFASFALWMKPVNERSKWLSAK